MAVVLEFVDALERGDVRTAERLLGDERVANLRDNYSWTVDDYIHKDWRPTLADLTGSPRKVAGVTRVAQTGVPRESWPVGVTIEGPNGSAYFTVASVDASGLGSFGVGGVLRDGIQTIYIHCRQESRADVAEFYAALLQTSLTPRGTGLAMRQPPRLAVGRSAPGELMPQWSDPARPQQMHVDLYVPDVRDSGRVAEERGATLLRDDGDAGRVYADPVGHPFCLHPGDADTPLIGRLVIDCHEPRALAGFYADLLLMEQRIEDTTDRVVIASADGQPPTLGFQRVAPYVAPTWGDPRSPQQYHFDLRFEDAPAARQGVQRLGAPRLQALGGTCPVYADPAGHPFCLCGTDE